MFIYNSFRDYKFSVFITIKNIFLFPFFINTLVKVWEASYIVLIKNEEKNSFNGSEKVVFSFIHFILSLGRNFLLFYGCKL